MANHCFKSGICLLVGTRRLAWHVGVLFAIPMAGGGLLLWLWP